MGKVARGRALFAQSERVRGVERQTRGATVRVYVQYGGRYRDQDWTAGGS